MPRGNMDKNYFQQTTGKITEASPLNYPEGSLLEAQNVEIDFVGTLKRRLGVQLEDGINLDEIVGTEGLNPVDVNSYVWENPRQAEGSPILVVSMVEVLESTGHTKVHLSFYDLAKRPITQNRLATLTVDTKIIDYLPRVKMVEAKGYLFVATGISDPIYIDYDPVGAQTFTIEEVEFKLRDTVGANIDGFPRSKSYTQDKLYDWVNQGWPYQKMGYNNAPGTEAIAFNFPWFGFKNVNNDVYPSSSDVHSAFTDATGLISEYLIDSGSENQGEAPKGKYKVPLRRNITNSEVGNKYPGQVSTLINDWAFSGGSVDTVDKGPDSVEFFQGHICYSGALSRKTSLRNAILISQSLTDVGRAGAIHSVNDPTSDIESSPIDTDGGVIRLEGVDEIVSLKVLGSSLLVFCTNGIWAISGPIDGLFTVNEVNITKISEEGCVSKNSIVNFKDAILFWGTSGIFSIAPQQASSVPAVTDLTESTIQEDYNNLNYFQKAYCKGVADPNARKIYWAYNSKITSNQDRFYDHDTLLIFDARSQGFYYYTIENEEKGPYVATMFVSDSLSQTVEEDLVLVGSDVVQIDEVNVTVPLVINEARQDNNLYLWGLTYRYALDDTRPVAFVAQFLSDEFKDWPNFADIVGASFSFLPEGGIDYVSYIESGYENLGDTMRSKQATYVFCYFNRTEEEFVDNGSGGLEFDRPSSCYLQTKWDWTGTGSSGRWTSPQQVYRFKRNYIPQLGSFNYDFDVVETKNKIRGKGKSLRMRFESESGKDFQLLGWATSYTAGATA